MTERQYYLWLRLVPDLGPKGHNKLLQIFETARNIYEAEEKELLAPELGKNGEKVVRFRKEDAHFSATEERIFSYEEKLRKQNVGYISLCDPDYPERLKWIFDPPIVIFHKGRKELLHSKTSMAIVGARNPSPYGREMTSYFSRELSKSDITIISGLAAGIDAESHKGAFLSEGNTIGILGSGINICYPLQNFSLYEKMCNEQLVISENGLNVSPLPFHFPLRNRIISGLSDGVLVIEARRKSGSLITADSALDQGKNVYALPGRAFDKLSEGTNHLIKMGAALVDKPEDILEDFFEKRNHKSDYVQKSSGITTENELASLEKIVYSGLSLEPVYIDDIIIMSNHPVSEVISALLSLEKRGLIKQPVKGYYILAL